MQVPLKNSFFRTNCVNYKLNRILPLTSAQSSDVKLIVVGQQLGISPLQGCVADKCCTILTVLLPQS